MTELEPVGALRRIAFLLEREHASTYKVRAFRHAADVLDGRDDVVVRAEAGSLRELPGLGESTAGVVADVVRTGASAYLEDLESRSAQQLATGGESLLERVRGDLHMHSNWSDGGSPFAEMAATARELGRSYVALTDHSPRLKVANGLTAERLTLQLEEVAVLNGQFDDGFGLLTGIEVDILDDGALDQTDQMLEQLDVVVASVHSNLRMDHDAMTRRMVTAIANHRTNILGHCTGRMVMGKGRPESTFDAELVFEACREYDVAVEINCRPERLDPPRRLLELAAEIGCVFSLDTDAHAPGQLDWLQYGAARAVDIDPDRIITTWPLPRLLAWTGSPRADESGQATTVEVSEATT